MAARERVFPADRLASAMSGSAPVRMAEHDLALPDENGEVPEFSFR